jgi:hypothetical protein
MTEGIQKKGMSKGCMVGLIIGLIIVIIVAALMVTCYMKKDELAKYGVETMLVGAKTSLAAEPINGIDSVKFNALIDQFVEQFNSEDTLDYAKAAKILGLIQTVPVDSKLDSLELPLLLDAMFTYYPDMDQSVIIEMEVDTTAVVDSI